MEFEYLEKVIKMLKLAVMVSILIALISTVGYRKMSSSWEI
jgi:hypothetical protein